MLPIDSEVPDAVGLRDASGHYRIGFDDAFDVCASRGMGMCTRAQIEQANRAGMEVCACGWASDGMLYYPMRHASPLCGGAAGVPAARLSVACFRSR